MSQNRRKSKIPQRKLPAQVTSLASSQCDIPAYLRPVQSTVYHKSAYDYFSSSEPSESHLMLQEKDPKSSKKTEKEAQPVACIRTPTQPPKRESAVDSTAQKNRKNSSLSNSSDAEFSKDGITVCLHDTNTWNRFFRVGNEMIVTKPGRRMFPILRLTLRGLIEKSLYAIEVRTKSHDKNRYKYTKNRWIAVTVSEIDQKKEKQLYRHPNSPNTGSFWMKKPINFQSCKITHDVHSKNGHILIHTMHKYVLEIFIQNVTEKKETTFPLPPTEFIAVTAYQNPALTSLKIDNNPFAKGFRERHDDVKKVEIRTPLVIRSNFVCPQISPVYVPPSPITPNSQFQACHFMPHQQPLFHPQQLPNPPHLITTPENLVTPPDTPASVTLPSHHPPVLLSTSTAPLSSRCQPSVRGLVSPPPFPLHQQALPPTTFTQQMYQTHASNSQLPASSIQPSFTDAQEFFDPRLQSISPMDSFASSLALPPPPLAPSLDPTQFPFSLQWQPQQQMNKEQYPLPDEASLKITENIDPADLLGFDPVSSDEDFPPLLSTLDPAQDYQQPTSFGLPPQNPTIESVQVSQYNDISDYNYIW